MLIPITRVSSLFTYLTNKNARFNNGWKEFYTIKTITGKAKSTWMNLGASKCQWICFISLTLYLYERKIDWRRLESSPILLKQLPHCHDYAPAKAQFGAQPKCFKAHSVTYWLKLKKDNVVVNVLYRDYPVSGNDVYLNWPCLYTWAVEQLVFLINEEITPATQNKLDPVDL